MRTLRGTPCNQAWNRVHLFGYTCVCVSVSRTWVLVCVWTCSVIFTCICARLRLTHWWMSMCVCVIVYVRTCDTVLVDTLRSIKLWNEDRIRALPRFFCSFFFSPQSSNESNHHQPVCIGTRMMVHCVVLRVLLRYHLADRIKVFHDCCCPFLVPGRLINYNDRFFVYH